MGGKCQLSIMVNASNRSPGASKKDRRDHTGDRGDQNLIAPEFRSAETATIAAMLPACRHQPGTR
jgi:hypothetical protein